MSNPVAPDMETYPVRPQKSAEGIVVPGIKDEGPNVEMSGASNDLDVGVESERMSRHRRVMESLSLDPISMCQLYALKNVIYFRLRPDDFHEPPTADPHGGWCGEGRLNAVPYPIGFFLSAFFGRLQVFFRRRFSSFF